MPPMTKQKNKADKIPENEIYHNVFICEIHLLLRNCFGN